MFSRSKDSLPSTQRAPATPPTGDIVLQFVGKQLEGIESWKETPGSPASIGDVDKLLKLDVPRGPADATSFHDFYSLRIAFDHVWEEAYDSKTLGQIERLYGEVVKIQPDWVFQGNYALRLMRDTDVLNLYENLPKIGTRLVIVALMVDANNVERWHIRIFAGSGSMVIDRNFSPEPELAQQLKTALNLPDPAAINDQIKRDLIQKITVNLGYVLPTISGLSDVQWLITEAQEVLSQRLALAGVPAAIREFLPELPAEIWARLTPTQQIELMKLALRSKMPGGEESDVEKAYKYLDPIVTHILAGDIIGVMYEVSFMRKSVADDVKLLVDYAKQNITEDDLLKSTARGIINTAVAPKSPIPTEPPVIEQLVEALKEPHAFTIFAADSVNYGILLNYRQIWEPQTYQVGDLIDTIPLAPKEKRTYTKKQSIKESRKRKELTHALAVHRGETSATGRAETEVVQRANEKTAFSASADVSGSIGVVSVGGKSQLDTESAKESARTKKSFREATSKAAQEVKNEQKTEIEFSSTTEFEVTTSGEISNPNEEIPVTFLFYELQRRYTVKQTLHNAEPVILVANRVPNPDEIDADWLLRHEWILRRVILDDEFRYAFDLLKQERASSNLEINTLRTHVQTNLRAFEDTKIELQTYSQARQASEQELRSAVDKYITAVNAQGSTLDEMGSTVEKFLSPGGLFGSVHNLFFGGGEQKPEAEKAEAAQARQEAVEDAMARLDRAITDTRSRLTEIGNALDQAIDKYIAAVRLRLNGELALMKLRVHVKDNILYYMQAIWDHEPPDQRYFRLCDIPVLDFDYIEEGTDLVRPELSKKWVTLKEVADLDNLLGYKGNYMIFRAFDIVGITRLMLKDYLDEQDRVRDPDQSLEAFLQGTQGAAVWRALQDKINREIIEPQIKEIRQQAERELQVRQMRSDEAQQAWIVMEKKIEEKTVLLRQQWKQKIADLKKQLTPDNEIVVPSELLFVAALPGDQPILESFKLKHRGLDVLKVATELEQMQVDLVRRKARLLKGEFTDDIDKRIQVVGKSDVTFATD